MLGIEGSKYLVELWAGNTSLDDYKNLQSMEI